jgi:hypothetical protein
MGLAWRGWNLMPLPHFPVFPSDDNLQQQTERYRHYLTRLRATLEGQERGVPNLVEQGQIWGVFPPTAGNLIIDPSFELNRDAWLLPLGCRVAEDMAALSGNYVLVMDSTEDYDGGLIIANAGAYTSCIPGQMLGLLGNVIATVGTTGTARATIQFYDAERVIVSSVVGGNVTVSGVWQVVLAKAIVPATAIYARFCLSVSSLNGRVGWDDTIALAIRSQNEVSESAGQVTPGTTEIQLVAATMGPLAQVPIGGTASVITPVMIQAGCLFFAGTGNGGSITFRIRRMNTTPGIDVGDIIIKQVAGLVGQTTMMITGFDTAPNVTAQSWALTAQTADGTGAPATSGHWIHASQHYN